MSATAADNARLDEIRLDEVRAELTAPGAPYQTTSVKVAGRDTRAFAQAPRNLQAIWGATADFAGRDYLIFEGERVTYGAAHRAVASVATWLARQGVGPGDRVAIAMRNYPEWMLAFWACLHVGAAAVGINAWWVADEITFALNDCEPKAVFCDAERRERLAGWLARHPTVPAVVVRAKPELGDETWSRLIEEAGNGIAHDSNPDEDACIFYTSGTTGAPKGARLTHRGCINTVVGVGFVTDLTRRSALPAGVMPADQPPPVALVTTPLFHVTANNALAQPVTAAGGALVLMRRWDPADALHLIEAERVTAMSGVPLMLRELVAHPDATRRDLSSLTTLSGGGAPVPPDLVARVAGAPAPMQPSTGYGMTETCGLVSAIAGASYVRRPASCGRPIPTFDARVVDDAGAMLPVDAVGELCVRGPGVIAGYLNRLDATDEAIVDGWLHTGDLARIDAGGYIFIVDRKKDMVLRGGENVYCAEVEAALYRHPAVAEACAFGIPDERLGEEVAAAVTLHADVATTEAGLRDYTAGLIASFKVPRRIWLLHMPLPRNASGKLLRRDLRAALLADDGAG